MRHVPAYFQYRSDRFTRVLINLHIETLVGIRMTFTSTGVGGIFFLPMQGCNLVSISVTHIV